MDRLDAVVQIGIQMSGGGVPFETEEQLLNNVQILGGVSEARSNRFHMLLFTGNVGIVSQGPDARKKDSILRAPARSRSHVGISRVDCK